MSQPLQTQLSRRERQIIDVLYRLGEAGVAEVLQHMPDEPAYNSIRVTLSILEKKGFVQHRQDGQRYIYAPVVPAEQATESAVSHMLKTFFGGSSSRAILTLLDLSSEQLSEEELAEIEAWIEQARRDDGA